MKKGLYIASLFALCAGAAFANDAPPNFVGGNTDGSDRDSSITSNVSGSHYWIAGGNQNVNAPTGNVNGDITLNLDNIDVSYGNGFICGGNLLNSLENPSKNPDTMGYVSGKVTVNFNSGTLSAGQGLYGGNGGGIPYQNNNYVGEVEINLNGGNVTNSYGVIGSGTANCNVKGDVVINVNAGKITDICGVGGNGKVGGKVLINAKGGKVVNIYGGGQGGNSVIDGGTNIVLGGDIAVSGNVYGGGWYNDSGVSRSTIKNGTTITLTDNATVAGTINGGGVNGKTIIEGKKVLNLGTSSAAYNGTSTLKIADFDEINVNKGTNARIESLTFNQTGAVVSGITVKDGASLVVEGDITRNYNDITNSDSLVAGINGGNAVVNGTVKTVIDGANTKLAKFYGGNGGNQKTGEYTYNGEVKSGPIPKGTSTVGAVDITVNNGTISDFILASGAMHSDVLGNVDVKINGGYVAEIDGGACGANIGGDINITVNGGKVGKIYAGSCGSGEGIRKDGIVGGSTNVVIGGDAVITGDVYGGGWSDGEKWRDTVKGSTNITLKDSVSVGGNLYGGSMGGTGTIVGTKNLFVGTTESAYVGSSALKVADFQKIAIVNGSANLASFTQAAEGTLVSISDKGKLSMSLNSASQLSDTSFENAGELVFKRGSLSDNDSVALKSYTGSGNVSAYGGTFSDGVFTAGKSAAFDSSAITVGTGVNDVQSVKLADKLVLDFNVAGLGEAAITVNEVKESTNTAGIDGKVLAAFDVNVSDNDNNYSVVFSAYVGALEDAGVLTAWHKGADGVWTKLDTAIDYANEIASITVDGFSSYAFAAAVPEPATIAAILGAVALSFAVFRRRK